MCKPLLGGASVSTWPPEHDAGRRRRGWLVTGAGACYIALVAQRVDGVRSVHPKP